MNDVDDSLMFASPKCRLLAGNEKDLLCGLCDLTWNDPIANILLSVVYPVVYPVVCCVLSILLSIQRTERLHPTGRERRGRPLVRVVLDSWVVNQIWLDSDSNESSQSWVDRENQGTQPNPTQRVESESNHADRHLSQSWVNLLLLESKLSRWFVWRENVKILYLSLALQRKSQLKATFDRPPPPPVNNFRPN